MRQKCARLLSYNIRLVAGVSGLVLSLNAPAWANAIYTYTGNPFTTVLAPYTTADRVTATMTLTSPLAPNLPGTDLTPNLVDLIMSDGVQTIHLANPGPGTPDIITFVYTDATGAISSWEVNLGSDIQIDPVTNALVGVSTTGGTAFQKNDNGLVLTSPTTFATGSVLNNQGVWTLVPEPGTVILLAMGLAAMPGLARRHTQTRRASLGFHRIASAAPHAPASVGASCLRGGLKSED
jgi:hypothetical protein